MQIIENHPLNTHALARMMTEREDLFQVMPEAKYPFCHDQWRETLDPDNGMRSFFIYLAGKRVGHAALRRKSFRRYKVCYFYLLPELQAKGLKEDVLELIEDYAKHELNAHKLEIQPKFCAASV